MMAPLKSPVILSVPANMKMDNTAAQLAAIKMDAL
jgi:hypothetical protein